MKKVLIIGGGFGGCTAVHELSKKNGWEITLVNPSEELGGGVRTNFYNTHPHTFGPRHFLTHNNEVFEYLDERLKLRLCKEHQFISYVADDDNFYNYPIHFDDIPRMPEKDLITRELNELEEGFKNANFLLTSGSPSLEKKAKNYEDFWKRSVGTTLYNKFIRDYTNKMWQISDNRTIDDFTWSPKGVAIKKGPREGWDKAISAYPIAYDGYNQFFDEAKSKVDKFIKGYVEKCDTTANLATINGSEEKYDLIINSAPLDDIMEFKHGKLKYIGRRIEFMVLPSEYALPQDVYFAYYTGKEKYTRIVEYKKFTQYKSKNTLISLEYPDLNQGKYYPMPDKENRDLYNKYALECNENFINVGRIALYNYRYDIDDVIEQVLEIVKNI